MVKDSFAIGLTAEIDQKYRLDSYKEFLKEDIPKLVNNYELNGNEVVIKIFYYNLKEAESSKFDVNTSKGDNTRTVAIAKVLLAGQNSAYKQGDFVKLRDFEAATMENPAYKKYSSGMGERPVGSSSKTPEPPRWVSNLANFFQEKIFVINPLNVDMQGDDFFTYKVSDGYISCKIKDPYAFIS